MPHFNKIKELLDNTNAEALTAKLKAMKYNDILYILERCNDAHKIEVYEALPDVLAIKCFKVLPKKTQLLLIKNIHHKKVAMLLNSLPDDDRTAFLKDCPSRVVNELVKQLNDDERTITLSLLGYPQHSVGRLMTPHYIAVKQHWTVARVFDFIRSHGQNSETVNVIYVVDDNGVLIDDIRIREFIFVQPETLVSDVMDHRYLQLLATDKETEAINIFRQHNRFALPVVDANGVLLGIVTIDDVLRLAEKEDTKEIQKIGGSEALDEPYTTISFKNLIKKRAGWLIILFLGEMLTATAMGFFEGEISKAVVLALFIPLIISSGGNSGSQASSLIIRAMALGEITFKDWWRVMRREILSGLTLGSILGFVGFLRILIWQQTHLYNDGIHWLLVAITIGFSLVGVVLWGTISGSMLPIALKKLGADPAASSAPFVATLVDVTGLVIYFSVAYIILRGTLL